MRTEFNKPIPKYIAAKILKLDRKQCPKQKGPTRLYSYLTKVKGELAKVTVAVKSKAKKQYIKQVAVHGLRAKECMIRDMEYSYLGGAYRIGWYAEGIKQKCNFEDGLWYTAKWKFYNAYTQTVNLDYIEKFPEYRYSAYKHFQGACIIKYLRLYEKYPQTEYLLKLGLHKLHDSVTVLKRIAKDKAFCKWLIAHREEIRSCYCYIETVMAAYKSGKPIMREQAISEFRKEIQHNEHCATLRRVFKRDSLERLKGYLKEKKIGLTLYCDYFDACSYLRLDMNDVKNRFPHDFKFWHDVRIDEYRAAQRSATEAERAAFYKKFAEVAKKYLALQQSAEGYTIIIARSPKELVAEGGALGHCVGKQNYEQKMVREESLIFFVRQADNLDVPFVTVEYSPNRKQVLQCYGFENKKPDETVLNFVNGVWLPHANKTIKKLLTA